MVSLVGEDETAVSPLGGIKFGGKCRSTVGMNNFPFQKASKDSTSREGPGSPDSRIVVKT